MPGDVIFGAVECEEPWGDVDWFSKEILSLYAGYAAEKKLDPAADPSGSGSDDEKAVHLLGFIEDTEPDLRARTDIMVNDNWEIIGAVAEALVEAKTLDREEWESIIDAIDNGIDWKAELSDVRFFLNILKGNPAG